MRRVLCVWLPTFSTDLVKRRLAGQASAEPGDRRGGRRQAVVLTRPVASRELVARRCEIAAAAGVAEGMDLAHARSLLPARAAPCVEPHSENHDAAALHAMACRALRFSPLAAPDPPDGLLIDITGTERLHRGEARLIRAVATGIQRLGFAARVAAASTFGCAWGVARFGAHGLSRVPTGREQEAIGRLPIAALRVDEPTVLALGEIGITSIGHVLALPRASLAARFDGILLRRLLQALGGADEHINPVRPVPPVQAELILDGPTDHWESVEAATKRVADELTTELARREHGARRLDLELLRPHAPPARIRVNLSRPSRAGKHLWSLLRSQLERTDLGGGVEGVVLTASRTARLRQEQRSSPSLGSDGEQTTPAVWGELMDTLAGRLGADGVLRMELVESHLPERAFRERSAMETPQRGPQAAVTGADRPTTLWARPEPADAMALTPNGPLLSLGWRNRRWNVLSCSGPERIGPEWWRWTPGKETPPDRDYFTVQTECGRRLWVFRHRGTHRWLVHGEWS
ncbi:MAG: Y-family DNA polymerase [Phycisphaerales bacterium]